ncbi:YfgM family protein [Otariodibacter oris]|uniref:Ancillary SecYEG translocon subunit n=1 Tax=Otariodibacter oris TaxID=1032623 RepID=A0A420XHV2_9PAST|nr:tetratricopeptide repeat protein [Otariodibacter oris]QGM81004.1 hypothetical protein A6A10_06085 [Otariodibacter oris]RKR76816.1 putative negative regulator of RcsB-dependent stress response [Otariodibacter oris]
MSDYYNSTEEQQFNEAKNWFKQNGTPILLVIALVSGASFGWNYWQNHQMEVSQATSAQYQQVMETYLQDPTKNAPLIDKFIDDNSGSYAVLAELEQARQNVLQNKFTEAESGLQKALSGTDDPTLQNIIRFRLASVQYQLGQYDTAIATLGNVQDKTWELRKQILVGDILSKKGDIDAARSAYEQAKANENASEQDRVLLDLRLNNL